MLTRNPEEVIYKVITQDIYNLAENMEVELTNAMVDDVATRVRSMSFAGIAHYIEQAIADVVDDNLVKEEL